MADRPNDRVPSALPAPDDLTPRIYLVVSGKKFIRPSLETYYAEEAGGGPEAKPDASCGAQPVGGVICTCNKVCTCNPQCSCQGHRSSCACESHRSSSGGGRYCSCVPVH